MTVRPARPEDDAALARIDELTWSPDVTPAARSAGPFFRDAAEASGVLVAEHDGAVAGYVRLRPATPLESNRHVLEITGLAVDPAHQRRGVARRLLDAAAGEARSRGARKLRLRVLAPNEPARALYEAAGFELEAVFREEFLLDGRYVDDFTLARWL